MEKKQYSRSCATKDAGATFPKLKSMCDRTTNDIKQLLQRGDFSDRAAAVEKVCAALVDAGGKLSAATVDGLKKAIATMEGLDFEVSDDLQEYFKRCFRYILHGAIDGHESCADINGIVQTMSTMSDFLKGSGEFKVMTNICVDAYEGKKLLGDLQEAANAREPMVSVDAKARGLLAQMVRIANVLGKDVRSVDDKLVGFAKAVEADAKSTLAIVGQKVVDEALEALEASVNEMKRVACISNGSWPADYTGDLKDWTELAAFAKQTLLAHDPKAVSGAIEATQKAFSHIHFTPRPLAPFRFCML